LVFENHGFTRASVRWKNDSLKVCNGGEEEARVGEISVNERVILEFPEHVRDVAFLDQTTDRREVFAKHLVGALERILAILCSAFSHAI
jgi:hypothetical protein